MFVAMSSGISSRFALYSVCSRCRSVGSAVSKTTAMWVGFSFSIRSSSVSVKPKAALVLKRRLLIRGFLMKLKYAR